MGGRSLSEQEAEAAAEVSRLARHAERVGGTLVVPSVTYDEVDARTLAARKADGSLSVKSAGASDETRLHVITAESKNLAIAGAMAGISRRDIAAAMGVSMETLLVHYGTMMAVARTRANTDVGLAALKKAKEGNVEAIKHWTKCRMGWKEKGTKAVVGVGGGGFNIAIVIDG